MMEALFQLRQFSLRQERSAQRVGTDALLLGACSWKSLVHEPRHILEIGTGTGIIALMLAQRFSSASIEAWEVEPAAAEEARGNFARSPFSEQLTLKLGDFCAEVSQFTDSRYDLIISNPPYYIEDIQPQDSRLQLARHTGRGLSPQFLLDTAHRLLAPSGHLALITPIEYEPRLRAWGVYGKMALRERIIVCSVPNRPKRLLSLWSPILPAQSYQPTINRLLTLQDEAGDYSAEYFDWLQEYLPRDRY